MSADNIIPLRRTMLDPGGEPFASTAPSNTAPATTLASTMALTGRTNLTMPLTEWRRPQRRKVYAALDALFPSGLPIEFQSKKVTAEVVNYCLERGWPKPGDKTIQRAISDRYLASPLGSS